MSGDPTHKSSINQPIAAPPVAFRSSHCFPSGMDELDVARRLRKH